MPDGKGPRGLLYVYAPQLSGEDDVVNFLAVEPIAKGTRERGLSELEPSQLDGKRGKVFWSANRIADLAPPRDQARALGWLEAVPGGQCLRVFILIERYESGAHVYLRLTFREDRPHEVGVAVYAHEDSTPLAHCIVTSTMGNYARLRRLQLADEDVTSTQLWPDYRGDGFTPHECFPIEKLRHTPDGGVMAAATPNEKAPHLAEYAPGTRRHWRYSGPPLKQTWRCADPEPELKVCVNGRYVYWASQAPIPGGVAFENFEMVAPFRQGREFWFGIKPIDADASGPAPVNGAAHEHDSPSVN